MKKILSFIAILSLVLTGCEGFDMGGQGGTNNGGSTLIPTDVLNDCKDELKDVSAKGDEVTLRFTPDFGWTAKVDKNGKDWITISPKSGEAGKVVTLKITVDENTDDEERSGKVTITFEMTKNLKFQ